MQNNQKLLQFLVDILGDYRKFGKEEYYFQCPFCSKQDGKKKFAVKLDRDAVGKNGESIFTSYHCWRDVTHAGHNLYTLLKKLNLQHLSPQLTSILKEYKADMDVTKINDKFQKARVREHKVALLPKEFKSMITDISNSVEYKNALRYLKKRGVTKGDIIKNNIGYAESGEYSGYIIIPSYNSNGEIDYFTARSYYDGVFKKHKTPNVDKDIIFNEMHINWNEPIILCEGPFDYLAIKRNAIPILGKYISNLLMKTILKKGVKKIYLALDNDALKDSLKHIETFLKNEIEVYLIKMTNHKDPSDAGFTTFWKYFDEATRIDFSEILKLKMRL
jgi:hypothetical protein